MYCYIRRLFEQCSIPLFSLLHPSLDRLPRISDFLIHHPRAKFTVHLGETCTLLQTLPDLQVCFRDSRNPLLVLPCQVRDVPHGDGEDDPASANTERKGRSCAEEDVAVARDDAAGHGGDKNVDSAGHELLVRLAGRGEGGDGSCEGLFEVES